MGKIIRLDKLFENCYLCRPERVTIAGAKNTFSAFIEEISKVVPYCSVEESAEKAVGELVRVLLERKKIKL